VKHRFLVRKNPDAPNLRQVHLIAAETLGELNQLGFNLGPGAIGENVLTRGIDLLNLPEGTVLQLGDQALVRITGLRNPCRQLNAYRPGLTAAVLDRDRFGRLIRKAGVMCVVMRGGDVRPEDPIKLVLPEEPHRPLDIV